LKFTQFMDGCEKNLVEELHTRWKYIMTAVARCSSGVAGPNLQRIMTCIKAFSCSSITIVVL
jgi:hypothetical protein